MSKKCCLRWVYADDSSGMMRFSKEAKGDEDPDIPFFSSTTAKLLIDIIKNPDAWKPDRDDSNPGQHAPPGVGVGPTNGKFKQRGTFCGDKLESLEGPPQYDWGSGNVG